MTTQAPYLSVNGVRASTARLVVPATGVWSARIEFDEVVSLVTGPVTLAIGALSLSGVVDTAQTGDYALASHVTLVGGCGGWSQTLPAKAYHNDAGVLGSFVSSDVAGLVGETIALDAGIDQTIGVDQVRSAGPASRVLELLYSASAWWVAADGSTHVGTRPTRDVTSAIELLNARPELGWAELIAEDPSNLMPGCSFTDSRLPGTFTIHDVEITIGAAQARAQVWSSPVRDSKLLALISQLVQRSMPGAAQAFPRRYRVVTLNGDRANLQYAPKNGTPTPFGFPDVLPVSVAPGVSGAKSQLTLGSLVLVEFVDGDPAQPVITHLARPDDPGFLPVSTTIDASGDLSLGHRIPANPTEAASSKRPVCYGDPAVLGTATGVITLGPAALTMSSVTT